MDNMQKNNKRRLYSNRNETVINIMNEYSKLAQKEYKSRHDWVERWSTENCTKVGMTGRKVDPLRIVQK